MVRAKTRLLLRGEWVALQVQLTSLREAGCGGEFAIMAESEPDPYLAQVSRFGA